MIEGNERKTKITPPYLSVSKLSQLISLISSRNFAEISPGDLSHYGFGESDTYVGVGTLRFLGLIDSANKIQESARKLHLQGASRTEAIAEMTRKAYSTLFDRVPNLLELDTEELHNEMLIAYGITPRIAKSALPAFLWLCEQGGLKEPSEEPARRAAPKSATTRPTRAAAGKKVEAVASPRISNADVLTFSFKGGVQLLIPNTGPDITTAIAQGDLKIVSDAINDFSRDHLINTEDRTDD